MIGRKDYEERKESRISQYEENAKKANSESESLYKKAHEMASVIPFGQPILVGHHSESSDRSYRKRIENVERQSFEAAEKAAYYEEKVETAKSNVDISGDNPDAINLYRKKLATLESVQEYMKAINKAFAQGDDALKALGLTDARIAKIKSNMPSYEKKPCPAWMLGNNSAEIRRVKAKIEQFAKLDVLKEEEFSFSVGKLLVNIESNRVQFFFDESPAEKIRALLKSHGFRWAPSKGAWQRQRTLNAISTAKSLVPEIEKLSGGLYGQGNRPL
ncbi:MAG: DUF3560 domain-containing protein [Treponema sp.]|jgi:hypothetical protein|nr:DUF3560 domain-containing protein [Treponema sp.]